MNKMNNSERLNSLYKEYGLTKDDYYKHQKGFYTIITRSGIDKIQAKANIFIEYDLIHFTNDCKTAIVKARAMMSRTEGGKHMIQTFGEVSPENNKNAYPIAMAEKRAMSRAVLKLAGFYQCGAFGEDEAEDFKKAQPKPMEGKPKRTPLEKGDGNWQTVIDGLKAGVSTYDEIYRFYDFNETDGYLLQEAANG